MIGFAWSGTPFPVTSTRNIYTTDGEQNYGSIGSQQIDQAIWDLMPQLPLYQSSDAYAVRTTLANFGASGFADVSYEDIGYTQ